MATWTIFKDGSMHLRITGDIVTADPSLTPGRVPFVSAVGDSVLEDSPDLTYDDVTSTFTTDTVKAEEALVLPKTSGKGIKVDTVTPTFGWRDMLGQIVARGSGSQNPRWNTYRAPIRQYQFDRSITEIWQNFHMPHDWLPGTDMYVHVHWSQTTVDTGGGGVPGEVEWEFDVSYADGYGAAGGAGDPFIAPVNKSIRQQGSTTQYAHMIAEDLIATSGGGAGLLDADDMQVDGVIMVRLSRTKSNDTLNQDPFVHFIDIHYQSNGVMGTKDKNFPFYT